MPEWNKHRVVASNAETRWVRDSRGLEPISSSGPNAKKPEAIAVPGPPRREAVRFNSRWDRATWRSSAFRFRVKVSDRRHKPIACAALHLANRCNSTNRCTARCASDWLSCEGGKVPLIFPPPRPASALVGNSIENHMTRLFSLFLAALILASGQNRNASAQTSPAQTSPAKRPNILWIVTDDQRADSIVAFNRMLLDESENKLGESCHRTLIVWRRWAPPLSTRSIKIRAALRPGH